MRQGIKSAVSLPVSSNGRTLAVISLASRKGDDFTPPMVRLLSAMSEEMGMM